MTMSFLSSLKNLLYKRRKRKCGLSFPVFCKVHGVKAPDRQGALVQSRNGDPLQIVHVPTKEYPFNVYVYSITLNRVLGYLDERSAEQFVYLFKNGFCKDAVLEQITGGPPTYPYYGCNIRVLESSVLVTETSFTHLRGE